MVILPTLDHICSEEFKNMCDTQIKTSALSTFGVVLALFLVGVFLTISIFQKRKCDKHDENVQETMSLKI